MRPLVLVPGAWLGGWCWRKVLPHLRRGGVDVYTPTLTGLGERAHLARPDVGLETHLQDVVNVLEYEDLHDALVLGHSYAGIVVTGVADRAPQRVGRLVYLDADVPDDGDSMLDDPEFRRAVEEQAQAGGDGWRWPLPDFAQLGAFASIAGISDDDLRWFRATAVPHPLKTMTDPLHLASAATGPPRTYIRCTAGAESEPEWATRLRNSPDWGYEELATGHWPMFSMPEELAAMLVRLAGS